jgi:myosin heavy subunit
VQVGLGDVNFGAMLHTFRLRLERDAIFTNIGPVLVVMNPYKPVPTCAPSSLLEMAKQTSSASADARILPPHAHSTVVGAFSSMMEGKAGTPQSLLVSGESGAGKTETIKLCMSALANISRSTGSTTDAALESGLLLEAFGNAMTVYNHNSSRFGKWCAVHFGADAKISAGVIQSYLLEESRVVATPAGERTYHVFYYMLAGMPEPLRSQLYLMESPSDYAYLRDGEICAPGIDDKAGWETLTQRLELTGFGEAEQRTVFELLAAVLSLGNVRFIEAAPGEYTEKPGTDKEDRPGKVAGPNALAVVADLLGLKVKDLEAKLISRVLKINGPSSESKMLLRQGSVYNLALSPEQCSDTRDAIARAVYVALFDHIISRLNQTLGAANIAPGGRRSIGFLDIFGFENFGTNGFEQLCINFTNERLQAHFTDALIRRQQAEWKREGVTCGHIAFPDNAPQLELLDSNKGGVLALLDEECAVPKGSDEGYVSKMHVAFDGSDIYSKPRRGKGAALHGGKPGGVHKNDKLMFIVRHYAGEVQYTASRWLEKNRGTLHQDIPALLASSSRPLLASLFKERAASDETKRATVGASYRASLRALSETMAATQQHYIRCIKPNMQQRPDCFNGQVVSRQLRYTGVAAVVEIQRSGYPISYTHQTFIGRYRCIAFNRPDILAKAKNDPKGCCADLLQYAQQLAGDAAPAEPWLQSLLAQVGATKVWMRADVLNVLEVPRRAVNGRAATACQRLARGLAARRLFAVAIQHASAVAAVRLCLSKKDVAGAEAALDLLHSQWERSKAAMAFLTPEQLAGGKVAAMRAEVNELAREVQDLKERVVLSWESGDRYEGGWKQDNPHGRGKYWYADGNSYEGQWAWGAKDGTGIYRWASGEKYEGAWADDIMHGQGVYTFADGATYTGTYNNGVRQGQGTWKYSDGGEYSGMWESGKKHGRGTYRDGDGKLVYDGEWKYNRMHGQGIFHQPDGGFYTGQFFEDKRHGDGQYTSPAGEVMFKGQWRENKPVTSAPQPSKASPTTDVHSPRKSFRKEVSVTELVPPSTPRGRQSAMAC